MNKEKIKAWYRRNEGAIKFASGVLAGVIGVAAITKFSNDHFPKQASLTNVIKYEDGSIGIRYWAKDPFDIKDSQHDMIWSPETSKKLVDLLLEARDHSIEELKGNPNWKLLKD